jgi:alkyl sulfatase BDS1-like metallo-beta-lactamase superfamily hydrolase
MKFAGRNLVFCLLILVLAGAVATLAQQQMEATNPTDLLRVGDKAVRVNDAISMAEGFGNTFLVNTSDGNVIIDTSIVAHAPKHKELLKAVSSAPVKYIILTHGHGDHTGGVPLWMEPGTQIVAQKNHVEFMHYQTRLAGFFAVRNAAQFALRIPATRSSTGNYGAKVGATNLFDDKYEFSLGGVKFEIYSTPGETPDHLTVWIPKYKAAFIGDNYYTSFPNIYTLRGTQPRWALDYVNSLNKVLALKPEIVLPSHGKPITGAEEITRRLTRYRDAIQYVHDETVKGMNSGKDVYTLMREIKLPRELEVGESYGKLSWSIRGIYEGYIGYFDMNPATMYELPPSSVYADVVKLAGGPDEVAKIALERAQGGRAVEALHLSEVALAADSNHRGALEARLKALQWLRERCRNSNERGWLDYSIRVTSGKLSEKR